MFLLPACSAKQPPAVPLAWHPVLSHFVIWQCLALCCLGRWHSRHLYPRDWVMRTHFHRQEHQEILFTLGIYKLCMCNVHKCKVLAVRCCHVEIGFSFADILNSKRKEGKTKSFSKLLLLLSWFPVKRKDGKIQFKSKKKLTLSAPQTWPTSWHSSHFHYIFPKANLRILWYNYEWV